MTQLPDVAITESGPVMYIGRQSKEARWRRRIESTRETCEECGNSFWRWEGALEVLCARCLGDIIRGVKHE